MLGVAWSVLTDQEREKLKAIQWIATIDVQKCVLAALAENLTPKA